MPEATKCILRSLKESLKLLPAVAFHQLALWILQQDSKNWGRWTMWYTLENEIPQIQVPISGAMACDKMKSPKLV